MPAEHSSSEREIDHLRKEIEQLKKQEPQFRIQMCKLRLVKKLSEINLVHNVYKPLTGEDVASCIAILKKRFPIATQFNVRTNKPSQSIASALLGSQWHFEPASKEEIQKYESDYPKWLEECRKALLTIHKTLRTREGQPSFTLEIENVGSRPAIDALVILTAKGNFRICPPPFDNDGTEASKKTERILPRRPRPPQGKWEHTLSPFYELMRSTRIGGLLGSEFPSMKAIPFATDRPPRDPNAFYYKQRRQTEPSDSFSLECEQWRHGTGWEVFHGDIFPREGVGDSTGVLEYEIHAGNLSKPILMKDTCEGKCTRSQFQRLCEPSC